MAEWCYNDMNWVVPGKLAVGDVDAACKGPELKKLNIRGIVTVRERMSRPDAYYRKYGINVLHIPITDHHMTNIGRYFAVAYVFIEKCIKQGHAVLVHCKAGISRSTTLVISYLMRKKRWTADQSIAWVKRHRPCADPNPGFIRQLHAYETVLRKYNLL